MNMGPSAPEKKKKASAGACEGDRKFTPKRKNCMKHKKKDKYENDKVKKIKLHQESDVKQNGKKNSAAAVKSEQVVKEKIHLPKSESEVSANWKKLLKESKELKKEKKKAKKKREKFAHKRKKSEEPEKEKETEVWFDDVDDMLIEGLADKKAAEAAAETVPKKSKENPLVKENSFSGVTKAVAIDCEMVGVGWDGKDSILARVSLVNQFGQCILDRYVKATETVTDYRTEVSGIRPEDMAKGKDFKLVQKEVHDLVDGKILVGHAISNDLKVLFMHPPRHLIRDTSNYGPFRAMFAGRRPGLKALTQKLLNVPIQAGEHNSVQDAQATMRLYTLHKKRWEKEIKLTRKARPKMKKKPPAAK